MIGPRAGKSNRAPKSLKARAIGLLARREYSRSEMRQKLLSAGAVKALSAPTTEEVDALLEELVGLGYLSDARFAKSVVRQKSGGFSQRFIAETLKSKGVVGETASEALAGNEVDDHVALVALWRRRFGRAPENDREKARQVRFLQSRGFSLSAIFKLLRAPPVEGDGSTD